MFRNKSKSGIDICIDTAIPPTSEFILQDTSSIEQGNSILKKYKCIPDAKLARKLLKLGNTISDIKPLKKEYIDADKKPSNFVFELTEKLISDYKEITGEDLKV
jgi:hypothetical protein